MVTLARLIDQGETGVDPLPVGMARSNEVYISPTAATAVFAAIEESLGRWREKTTQNLSTSNDEKKVKEILSIDDGVDAVFDLAAEDVAEGCEQKWIEPYRTVWEESLQLNYPFAKAEKVVDMAAKEWVKQVRQSMSDMSDRTKSNRSGTGTPLRASEVTEWIRLDAAVTTEINQQIEDNSPAIRRIDRLAQWAINRGRDQWGHNSSDVQELAYRAIEKAKRARLNQACQNVNAHVDELVRHIFNVVTAKAPLDPTIKSAYLWDLWNEENLGQYEQGPSGNRHLWKPIDELGHDADENISVSGGEPSLGQGATLVMMNHMEGVLAYCEREAERLEDGGPSHHVLTTGKERASGRQWLTALMEWTVSSNEYWTQYNSADDERRIAARRDPKERIAEETRLQRTRQKAIRAKVGGTLGKQTDVITTYLKRGLLKIREIQYMVGVLSPEGALDDVDAIDKASTRVDMAFADAYIERTASKERHAVLAILEAASVCLTKYEDAYCVSGRDFEQFMKGEWKQSVGEDVALKPLDEDLGRLRVSADKSLSLLRRENEVFDGYSNVGILDCCEDAIASVLKRDMVTDGLNCAKGPSHWHEHPLIEGERLVIPEWESMLKEGAK